MSFPIRFHPQKGLLLFLLFSINLLLLNLYGCSYPTNSNPQGPNAIDFTQNREAFPVKATFNLHLPEYAITEENLSIEIIDGVTGTQHHKKIYELKQIDNQLYSTEITLQKGTVLKYRYSVLSEGTSPERMWNGEPVCYRLLYVGNDVQVNDHLQTWAGKMQTNNTGRITGVIIDSETKSPVPDIMVSAGGQLTFSDGNGKFNLEYLSPQTHNLVFYSLDGKYQTFQQEARISPGLVTPAEVELTPNKKVNLTFEVTSPDDAKGAPIYLAGNLLQLGNTFSDLSGEVSLKQSKMPQLTLKEDGFYHLSLSLYSGSYIRYKFTMGDGYWNAERDVLGEIKTREMIVPTQDTTITATIESWRSGNIAPITFQVEVKPERLPEHDFFIQFNNGKWTKPILLWPIGNDDLLYILYSPLEGLEALNFMVCHHDHCANDQENTEINQVNTVKPSEEPLTVSLSLDSSPPQNFLVSEGDVINAYVPKKGDSFQTTIELSPSAHPNLSIDTLSSISNLAEINVSTLVFTPQWVSQIGSPILFQNISATPFFKDLVATLVKVNSMGFSTSLFPQIGPIDEITAFWDGATQTDSWWEIWFDSYADFLLNYAKAAELSGANHFIIGGKFLLPTFSGGLFPNGSFTNVPSDSNTKWQELIQDIRNIFAGEIYWATNIHQARDPLPEFILEFDGIYLLVDSPLIYSETDDLNTIKSGFINVVDSLIYEVFRSTGLPITIGLGYPSVDGAALGCKLLENNCINDGIFSENELKSLKPDMQEQSLIYNAIFPVISSRDWITGVSIRGYLPTTEINERSSSINGKPALQVIDYWFSGLTKNQ